MKIVVYAETGDLSYALVSLQPAVCNAELILIHAPEQEKGKLLAICENLVASQRIASFALHELAGSQTWHELATKVLCRNDVKYEEDELVFFLSSSIRPCPDCLSPLAARLHADDTLGIVNPLLVAGEEGEDKKLRVMHMGIAVDSQMDLHYLYAGLPVSSELASRRRYFQLAHPGAALMRLRDFVDLHGFNWDLGEMCWTDFCVRLKGKRVYAASTEPCSRAILTNIFDSWERCGVWNSLRRLGKLQPGLLKADFYQFIINDGLEYGLTLWLEETATNLPTDAPQGTAWEAWIKWWRNGDPVSLINLFPHLSGIRLLKAVQLCQTLAASLPRSLDWYIARAKSIAAFASVAGLENCANAAEEWLAKARRFHHGVLKPALKALLELGIYNCSLDEQPFCFDAWLELCEGEPETSRIEPDQSWPEIAVIMPVYNPRPEFLREAIESVRRQTYGNWQLCIADDASPNSAIRDLLLDFARRDRRVRLVFREANGHISLASNSALELATAPWSALMDHDDALPRNALLEVAAAIAQNPSLNFIYTDEDKITEDGVRRRPVFKPDFCGNILLGGHLLVFRTELLRGIGGLRTGVEGAQDSDLTLRFTEQIAPDTILHIPRILYHWRVHEGSTAGSVVSKPYVMEATRKVMRDRAGRLGLEIEEFNTERKIILCAMRCPEALSCSVVLLFDAQNRRISPELEQCLAKMAEKMPLEVLAQDLWPELGRAVSPDQRFPVRHLPYAGKRWTRACMGAALAASGNVLFFIHAGLKPWADCRPEQMAIQAMRKDTAVAGGIVWKNGRLWNGGYYPDITGLPFPLLRGLAPELLSSYCWGQLLRLRHVIGVPWQCMAIRKDVFRDGKVFNDEYCDFASVDYSLRQERKGLYTLVSPWANWNLPEEFSEREAELSEKELFLQEWGNFTKCHGLRNPNLRAAPDNDWMLVFGQSNKPGF